ncbi:MAG TPA: hypothetical protein VJ746_18235 [Nitrospira sp.]|nr:hypothetical protein [Nitrospira sp.]
MRCRVLFLLACSLFASPGWVAAGDTGLLPPPTFSIPFDDLDESTLQQEVSNQALSFLQTVESHWGGDRLSVRRDVAGDIREDEQGKLIFLRNIADHGVLEGYEFHHEALVRGQYILLQQPLNGLNEFIGYYEALKLRLAETYGAPAQDHVVWDNDLYQPLPDYWGVAVMIGHLRYRATWETVNGTITLELTGNRHSRLFLEYTSRNGGALT